MVAKHNSPASRVAMRSCCLYLHTELVGGLGPLVRTAGRSETINACAVFQELCRCRRMCPSSGRATVREGGTVNMLPSSWRHLLEGRLVYLLCSALLRARECRGGS
eukprot:1158591-Pelagomonas_calceolata.AAC.2